MNKCKGLFFRYRKSVFPSGAGIGLSERITLLKSKSCKGCDRCETHIVDQWVDIIDCFDQLPIVGRPMDGDELKLIITAWDEDEIEFHFVITGSANEISNWRERSTDVVRQLAPPKGE